MANFGVYFRRYAREQIHSYAKQRDKRIAILCSPTGGAVNMRCDGYSGAGFVYRSVTLSTCAIYHNVLGILYSLLPRCLTAQNSIASSSKVGLV